MSITWEDQDEERWLTNILDTTIQSVFIQFINESIEGITQLKQWELLTTLNLLMLRKNTKLSILIKLKARLNTKADSRILRLIQKFLEKLIFLSKLHLIQSKLLIKRDYRTGDLMK